VEGGVGGEKKPGEAFDNSLLTQGRGATAAKWVPLRRGKKGVAKKIKRERGELEGKKTEAQALSYCC